MQKQNFLKCIICGKSYRGCRTCRGRAEYSPWRNVCDTPRHYQVYRIIQDLDVKILSKSEAKEMLGNIGITSVDLDGFLPSVKSLLEPLFAEKKSRKTKDIAIEEDVSEKIDEGEAEIEAPDEQ